MSRQPVVTVIGSFMMDLVIRTERRPGPGETVVGQEFGMFPGGKGVNQAVTARRMGARVHMVGRVGADAFGEAFLSTLSQEGIDAAFVLRDESNGTGVGAPVIDASGQNAIIIIPRANMAVSPADVERARPAIEASDLILLQNEIPHEANLAAAALARRLGKRVVYNPAPFRAGVGDLVAMADVVTPNESEALGLIGIDPRSPDEAVAAVQALLTLGVRSAVITLGANGAMVADGTAPVLHLPTWKVPVVDTTGAGDAFNGALALSLAHGLNLADAAAVGCTAGALAVTRLGAVPAMPTLEQVREFWRRHEAPDLLGR